MLIILCLGDLSIMNKFMLFLPLPNYVWTLFEAIINLLHSMRTCILIQVVEDMFIENRFCIFIVFESTLFNEQ